MIFIKISSNLLKNLPYLTDFSAQLMACMHMLFADKIQF